MTQEEKELVLKDLCARLPYGVHVEISWEYSKTDVYTSLEYYEFPNIDSLLNIFWDEKCISIKPYLRPMDSMTAEEEKEFLALDGGLSYNMKTKEVEYKTTPTQWLDARHFDYRGMIKKDLALIAPEDMYNDRNV